MKVRGGIALTIVFSVHFSAVVFAQKVTFRKRNATLSEVFKTIKERTGYSFVWSSVTVNEYKLQNIEFNNAPLKEVLDQCLKNLPFRYEIQDKMVVIKDKVNQPQNTNPLLKGQIKVKGQIADPLGAPLSRATVRVLGSNRTVLTSSDGYFSLDKIDSGTNLLISFLSYKELTVSAKEDLGIITLSDSSGQLGEIVILSTGYQQLKKNQLTGAASYLKGADLVMTGNSSLEQMLQGRIPGLEILNNSGQVGRKETVKVRGVSTLLGNQEPVWVVDGIIQEDPLPFKSPEINQFNQTSSNEETLKNYIGGAVSGINPFDIEDITVLKDAASTAIYGVKAANGVIVINTKKGRIDRPVTVNYSTNFFLQEKPGYSGLNMMNSKERIDVSREIWNRGLASKWPLDDIGYSGLLKQFLLKEKSFDEFNSGVKQLETTNTNWFDVLFKTSLSQSHNISMSGGSNRNTYYGSFGYLNRNGEAKGNDMTTYMANVNITSYVSSKLSVSLRLSANRSRTSGFFGVDPYEYARTTSRVLQPYNTDGSLSYYKKEGYNFNMLNEIANTGNNVTKTDFNSVVSLAYTFSKGFQIESVLGMGYSDTHAASYASAVTNRISVRRRFEYGQFNSNSIQYKSSPLPVGGEQATVEDDNSNYTWRNGLSYGTVFNDKHALSALFGFELRSNHHNGLSKTIFGYMPEQGGITANPPATILDGTGQISKNDIYSYGFKFDKLDRTANYVSYYLNGTYTYDSKYVFSLSLRGDASNRFGGDTRTWFNPIWAIGGKWITDNISFRASYGLQGNVAENYGPNLILSIPEGTAAYSSVTGEPILKISSLPYADLRWEKTKTVNLGLDLNLIRNRVTGSFDYYNKNGKDIVIQRIMPYENGALSMPTNGGSLNNHGFEAMINIIPVMSKEINWSIALNGARNFNKVTSKLQPDPTWNDARSGNYFVQGYPVSAFWVFDLKGLDHQSGSPLYNIPTTAENPSVKVDAAAYMKYAGNLYADFTAGLNNTFNYKRFTFSMNLYASLGGRKLLAPLFTQEIVGTVPNEYNNLSNTLNNRWRKPGDEMLTNIPSLPSKQLQYVRLPEGITVSPYTMYNFSSVRVVNASYLRINNMSFYYSLPEKIARTVFSKKINIGYTLSNLYTFRNKGFNGVDAEVLSGNQPLPPTYIFNLSAVF
ncbi:SusC/RagA family TonB-linked outer membrane protein [Pedobacter sp. V48]|uniref:SusC/RagA family TonB-linked outer membrane protein n=1 Tax=Pedobacter sp. V48 TaxID=509635 RepID=UPI0003E556E0|nr:SusC/RagA family TonB-linked outer membrane protein [Pedobacter sp. V48]ETZ24634.1 hypothetical protein N824_14045 [Pedobacter sp. V48]